MPKVAPTQLWEYRWHRADLTELVGNGHTLALLGRMGWELVSVTCIGTSTWFWFKREIK